jgi:transglutaminase-like putative cysteine protease
MHLKVTHRTEYRYDTPIQYGLQRLRLVPNGGACQSVQSWTLNIEGAREEARFVDQFGNDTRLVSIEGEPHIVSVEATGEVLTHDKAGVTGAHKGFAPLWLFERPTPLTEAGAGIRELAASVDAASDIERLHCLMNTVRERVAYMPGVTKTGTTAEEALSLKSGVCQDHTHIFISAARLLGFPARYVSGYLMMVDSTEQVASHAWAEAHVKSLGWVAFDAANGISPDERYVRLATGRDYRDAAPVSGIRIGQAAEQLAVSITVEQ